MKHAFSGREEPLWLAIKVLKPKKPKNPKTQNSAARPPLTIDDHAPVAVDCLPCHAR